MVQEHFAGESGSEAELDWEEEDWVWVGVEMGPELDPEEMMYKVQAVMNRGRDWERWVLG